MTIEEVVLKLKEMKEDERPNIHDISWLRDGCSPTDSLKDIYSDYCDDALWDDNPPSFEEFELLMTIHDNIQIEYNFFIIKNPEYRTVRLGKIEGYPFAVISHNGELLKLLDFSY